MQLAYGTLGRFCKIAYFNLRMLVIRHEHQCFYNSAIAGRSVRGLFLGAFHSRNPGNRSLVDLKHRDMLKDTLVIWSGEFGRTPMQENRGGQKMT